MSDNAQLSLLQPVKYDYKSYRYKAVVVSEDAGTYHELYSHGVHVATVMADRFQIKGWFSVGTARHINDFLFQKLRLRHFTKQEMELMGENEWNRAEGFREPPTSR